MLNEGIIKLHSTRVHTGELGWQTANASKWCAGIRVRQWRESLGWGLGITESGTQWGWKTLHARSVRRGWATQVQRSHAWQRVHLEGRKQSFAKKTVKVESSIFFLHVTSRMTTQMFLGLIVPARERWRLSCWCWGHVPLALPRVAAAGSYSSHYCSWQP